MESLAFVRFVGKPKDDANVWKAITCLKHVHDVHTTLVTNGKNKVDQSSG